MRKKQKICKNNNKNNIKNIKIKKNKYLLKVMNKKHNVLKMQRKKYKICQIQNKNL